MFQRLASTPQIPPTASATQPSQLPQAHSQMVVKPPQLPQPLVSPQCTTPPVTKAQEPMDTSAPQGVPTIKKGLKGIKGSAPIAASTNQAVIAPPPAPIQPQVLSPLQRLEKREYGADGSSYYTSMSQPEDSGEFGPLPKADFHVFVDRVRLYLAIDDLAKTAKYKLRSELRQDPNIFRMEQSSRPPSPKLLIMDSIAKLLQNQDSAVKPGPPASLDIGNWYQTHRERKFMKPKVIYQHNLFCALKHIY